MSVQYSPYWWGDIQSPKLAGQELPDSVDVLVIGSGYTGLHAALQTSRAGRSTLVIDAKDAGWGCSTRNGGQVSTSVSLDFATLAKRHGEEMAYAIIKEGQSSLRWIKQFIRDESINCQFEVNGHFHAAHNSRAYEKLCRAITQQPAGQEEPAFVVSPDEQSRETGTRAYHGGVVYTDHAALHPGLYHAGLMSRVLASGVDLIPHCAAIELNKTSAGYRVKTQLGEILARDVVVASNGYSGSLLPWLKRRVIPIGSSIISTEEMPAQLMDKLMPSRRTISDSRKVVYYYRTTADRKRILFGGRVAAGEISPEKSAYRLKRDLDKLFPELKDTGISHSWSGLVAYSFDTLAHIGCQEGVFYAASYCGSGVGMSSYLGMRLGQKVLGLPEGKTAFDNVLYQTRPFYTGKPWFLAPSVAYYRMRDLL